MRSIGWEDAEAELAFIYRTRDLEYRGLFRGRANKAFQDMV